MHKIRKFMTMPIEIAGGIDCDPAEYNVSVYELYREGQTSYVTIVGELINLSLFMHDAFVSIIDDKNGYDIDKIIKEAVRINK